MMEISTGWPRAAKKVLLPNDPNVDRSQGLPTPHLPFCFDLFSPCPSHRHLLLNYCDTHRAGSMPPVFNDLPLVLGVKFNFSTCIQGPWWFRPCSSRQPYFLLFSTHFKNSIMTMDSWTPFSFESHTIFLLISDHFYIFFLCLEYNLPISDW